MKLKKHLFVFLIFNLTIYSVISEDISLIEETLKNVETKINHINKVHTFLRKPQIKKYIFDRFEFLLKFELFLVQK